MGAAFFAARFGAAAFFAVRGAAFFRPAPARPRLAAVFLFAGARLTADRFLAEAFDRLAVRFAGFLDAFDFFPARFLDLPLMSGLRMCDSDAMRAVCRPVPDSPACASVPQESIKALQVPRARRRRDRARKRFR
ncbi:MAG TPA: hypothetical protein VIH65_04600, partial [Xanthobacteraceae bacterium]